MAIAMHGWLNVRLLALFLWRNLYQPTIRHKKPLKPAYIWPKIGYFLTIYGRAG